MTLIVPPHAPVVCPGLWKSNDLEDQWVFELDDNAISQIDAALRHVETRDLMPPHFGQSDFPLSTLKKHLDEFVHELEYGRGFMLVRGFPLADYSSLQAERVFWGLTTHMGTHVAINAYGDKLGHVRDLGLTTSDNNVRNYQTREELKYHNDKCDVIGLMCINKAKEGGASSIASAPAIHNAILERYPDLLRALYQPLAIDQRGEPGGLNGDDELGFYSLPVFSWFKNNMTTRYSVRAYYDSAQRFDNAPRLTADAARALDLVQEIANEPEMHIDFVLEPGDMQFMNNYAVLHSRTAFIDHEMKEQRRHLLRIWLAVSNSRPLPDLFASSYGATQAGVIRGGVHVSKSQEQAPLPA